MELFTRKVSWCCLVSRCLWSALAKLLFNCCAVPIAIERIEILVPLVNKES